MAEKKAEKSEATKKTPRAKSASRGRRAGTRYSDEKRQQILTAAERDGLTALEVQKRFGVTPVTYYSWRKKGGAAGRRRKRAVAAGAAVGRTMAGAMNLADVIRDQLRTHIRQLLPEVIASELGKTFGGGRRRRRKSR